MNNKMGMKIGAQGAITNYNGYARKLVSQYYDDESIDATLSKSLDDKGIMKVLPKVYNEVVYRNVVTGASLLGNGENLGINYYLDDELTINILAGIAMTPYAHEATNVTETSFTANWQDVNNETGYILEVATSPAYGDDTIYTARTAVGVCSKAVGIESGEELSPSTVYYYRVCSYNSMITSGYSETIIQETL